MVLCAHLGFVLVDTASEGVLRWVLARHLLVASLGLVLRLLVLALGSYGLVGVFVWIIE